MSVSSEAKKGYLFVVVLLLIGGAIIFFRGTGKEEAPLLEVVPSDAVAVLHVSDMMALGKRFDRAAEALSVDRRVRLYKDNLSRQLGFDPFDYDEVRRRGINPDGGLLVYSPPPGRFGVVVLDVRDRGTFETRLVELLSARTGAQRGEDRDFGGVTVHVAEVSERPVVAWAYRGSAVLISAGADCAGRVAEGAAAENKGIEGELWFQRGLNAVEEGASLFAWASADGAGRVLRQTRGAVQAMAMGLQVSDEGLRARGWIGIDAPQRNVLDPLKGSYDASKLLQKLDPEAVAIGRFHVDLSAAWALARLAGLPRHLDDFSAQLTARGLRLERDILPLFEGSFLADAGLLGQLDLGSITSLDPRRLNPFLYLKTTIMAPLADPKKAEELMPLVAQAVARAVRGRLETVEVEGHEAFEIHYRFGRGMTFGVAGDVLLVAGGEGAYGNALNRLAGNEAGFLESLESPTVLDGFARDGAFSLLVHVPNLMAAAEDLDSDSFGGGPTGMMIHQTAKMFMEPVSRLTLVLATVSVDDHGLAGFVEVGFEQEGEAD